MTPPDQSHEPAHRSRLSLPALLWSGFADAFVATVSWFLGVTALAVIAGALLVGVHGRGGWLGSFDARVNMWFGQHHISWIVHAAKDAAPVGSVGGLAVISIVVGLVMWWIGWRMRAIVPLVAFLGAEAAVFVAKELIARHRPPTAAAHLYPWVHGVRETDLSFPSGHSTATAAVLVAIAMLLVGQGERGWPWLVAVVLAAAMAAGRLILGVHWFSDVAVGLVVGALWGGAVAWCLREPKEPLWIGSPAVPG